MIVLECQCLYRIRLFQIHHCFDRWVHIYNAAAPLQLSFMWTDDKSTYPTVYARAPAAITIRQHLLRKHASTMRVCRSRFSNILSTALSTNEVKGAKTYPAVDHRKAFIDFRSGFIVTSMGAPCDIKLRPERQITMISNLKISDT